MEAEGYFFSSFIYLYVLVTIMTITTGFSRKIVFILHFLQEERRYIKIK